jgi:hypothetical protein
MTDFSIASPKIKMGPGPRALSRPYEKMVLLISGKSGDGKSSLAQLLLTDQFNYVSSDAVCLDPDCHIQSLLDQTIMGDRYNLGQVAILIEQTYCQDFIRFLFTKYILNSEKQNIILDGFLFTLKHCKDEFFMLCKVNQIRIWDIQRIL